MVGEASQPSSQLPSSVRRCTGASTAPCSPGAASHAGGGGSTEPPPAPLRPPPSSSGLLDSPQASEPGTAIRTSHAKRVARISPIYSKPPYRVCPVAHEVMDGGVSRIASNHVDDRAALEPIDVGERQLC